MPKTNRSLPTTGFAILVDGCVKAEFSTKDGAESGARDLKRRFPVVQVKIYDAHAKMDHVVPNG